MNDRITRNAFLANHLPQHSKVTPVSGDASFRCYFRTHDDKQSFILMDAPPDKENSELFVVIAQAMAQAGIPVPEIIAADFDNGYLLLEDFGDAQLANYLQDAPADYLPLALNQLLHLQLHGGQHILALPDYDATLLLREMALFNDYFVNGFLNITLTPSEQQQLDALQQYLLTNIEQQPKTWVHRDFHSRNLMLRDEQRIGILDFQDAVFGPITYDLVSLLKDAYVKYSPELLQQMLEKYYILLVQHEKYPHDFAQFVDDFECMGLQRHLKVLGIFARLSIRDNKHGYLKDLPRVFDYVENTLKQPRLQNYAPLFERLKPLFLAKMQTI